MHSVKSVRITSFSAPCFTAFGLNTERKCSDNLFEKCMENVPNICFTRLNLEDIESATLDVLAVLKNLAIFIEKHMCWSLFLKT